MENIFSKRTDPELFRYAEKENSRRLFDRQFPGRGCQFQVGFMKDRDILPYSNSHDEWAAINQKMTLEFGQRLIGRIFLQTTLDTHFPAQVSGCDLALNSKQIISLARIAREFWKLM